MGMTLAKISAFWPTGDVKSAIMMLASMTSSLRLQSQALCVDSRAQITRSRARLASARRVLVRWPNVMLRGGSDAPAQVISCRHPRSVIVKVRGARADVEQQRRAVMRGYQRLYVSDVVEITDGEWGWLLCPDCPARPLDS